jgi:hypothetical protein
MRRTACLLLFALGCPAPLTHTTGLGIDPGVQLASTDDSEDPPDGSSSTTGRDSTGDLGTTGTIDHSTGLAPQPDFGPVAPQGCAGKIDFLFVIDSMGQYSLAQEQMLEAVPAFYQSIAGAFPEFDTHILVSDADA